jgi:hypothetical protein
LVCLAALVFAGTAGATTKPTITSAAVVANDTVEITYTGVTGPTVNLVIWEDTIVPMKTVEPEPNTGDVVTTTDDGGYYYFQICQPGGICSSLVKLNIP